MIFTSSSLKTIMELLMQIVRELFGVCNRAQVGFGTADAAQKTVALSSFDIDVPHWHVVVMSIALTLKAPS